jgi:hypothetical protein
MHQKKPWRDLTRTKKEPAHNRAGCFGSIVHEIIVNIPGVNDRAAAARDNPHTWHFPQSMQRGGVPGTAGKGVTMEFFHFLFLL